jgi:molybdopterin synthase catalytic subunit
MRATISSDPLDSRALRARVSHPGAGAIVLFEGTTRDSFEGRAVQRLEYEAYEPMACREMERICAKVQERWPESRIAMAHRVGVVAIGEISIAIAVSSPHRGDAYLASRFAIDAVKAQVPIWKKEIYEDGTCWKANKESGGVVT